MASKGERLINRGSCWIKDVEFYYIKRWQLVVDAYHPLKKSSDRLTNERASERGREGERGEGGGEIM